MKQYSPLFLVLGSILYAIAAHAEYAYKLIEGSTWRGVKIGGQAPKSPDIICRNSYCVQLLCISLPTKLMQQYGLKSLAFAELAVLDGVTQKGKQLVLPVALGQGLFTAAVRAAQWESDDRSVSASSSGSSSSTSGSFGGSSGSSGGSFGGGTGVGSSAGSVTP